MITNKLYLHGAAVFESLLQGVDIPEHIVMTENEDGNDFQERMMTDYDDGPRYQERKV